MSSQDCVVTSFFIDCAHNVVEFIELIHRILKPGGKWINFGPLLYHFAEIPRESSIEPSYDIVRSIIEKTGFEFKREGMYISWSPSIIQLRFHMN
jgi:carnosine N-methyltransferase